MTFSAAAGTTIRYTTNGSTPTSTCATIYTAPISVTGTITITAKAFQTDWTPSAAGRRRLLR